MLITPLSELFIISKLILALAQHHRQPFLNHFQFFPPLNPLTVFFDI